MMKTVWMAVSVALAATAFAFGGTNDDDVTDEALRRAHEDLQRALETIRTYHLQQEYEGIEHLPVPDEDLLMALRRPRMGILVEPASTGSGDTEGVRIMAVTPAGPADEAGLRTGDVITHVDGVALAEEESRAYDALIRQLATHAEGDAVLVDFVRDGEARSASVVLGGPDLDHLVFRGPSQWEPLKHPEMLEAPSASGAGWYFPGGWLDMELVSLNADLGEYFGTDEGVLVVRGPSDSELGLKGGDVIVAIGDRIVRSPTHAMRILRSFEPGERMILEIMRRGGRESIDVTIPENRVPILESWEHHD